MQSSSKHSTRASHGCHLKISRVARLHETPTSRVARSRETPSERTQRNKRRNTQHCYRPHKSERKALTEAEETSARLDSLYQRVLETRARADAFRTEVLIPEVRELLELQKMTQGTLRASVRRLEALRASEIRLEGVAGAHMWRNEVWPMVPAPRNEDAQQQQQQQPDSAEEASHRCVICMSNKSTCVIIDCGHKIVCTTCARELMLQDQQRPQPQCPVCRCHIRRGITYVYEN